MSNLTPQQQKALDTVGHLALTANAGSGKTFVLARKYLSILVKENVDVFNIAAITFTEKAASELYSKISQLIDDEIKSIASLDERKKLEKIRRQLVSANISTIHSFCIDILRKFPVESNLDARFTPIDENLSSELIELSVEETVRSAFDNSKLQEDLKYLIRILGSKSRLQNELVNMIKNRKNVFAVQKNIYSKDQKLIQQHFSNTFNEYFLLIWDKLKTDFIQSLNEINAAVLNNDSKNQIAFDAKNLLQKLESEKNIANIVNLLNSLKTLVFTKAKLIKTQGFLKKDVRDGLSNKIKIAQESIIELSQFELTEESKNIETELAIFGLIILELFEQSLKNYETKKKSEGYIDFEDILLHTKILLGNEGVKRNLYNQYKYILVDEFQDTNEIQYQIFLPILNYLKSGNLIIVGDEKQSIYKFRDAEIEVFNLTRNQIKTESSIDNILNLPDSFRMSPAICVFTNYLFKNLFSNPDVLFNEVPNTELVCARNDKIEGKVEFLISEIKENENSLTESELVVNKILEIINDCQYSFKDICILVRKRKSFEELEQVFLKNKIPYSIIGGRGFYQRQTISDIYNYLSFLVDVNNSAALVGILRSPFFTLSDSELYEISLASGKNFWDKLQSSSGKIERYQGIVAILKENIKLSDSIELPQLLKKLVTDQNYLTVLATRIDGDQELANFEKLISISRNFNSKGFRNLYDFINYLKESIAGIEDEAQASFSAENDAVKMMTIHQAKGLEFPVVFLFKTADRGVSSVVKSRQLEIDKKFGILTKVPIKENYFEDYQSAPILSVYNYLESKKNLAELKRLLYVGITRAKDELYISAAIDDKRSFYVDSFISLLSSGLDVKFDKSKILISDELKFLVKENENYSTYIKSLNLDIPIINELDIIKKFEIEPRKLSGDLKFQLEKLESLEKGEIISASKVSVFNQCPLKYHLIYEYGFSKLNSKSMKFKKNNEHSFVFDYEEDDVMEVLEQQDDKINIDAANRGRIIHQILEKEISLSGVDDFIKNIKAVDEFSFSDYQIELNNIKNDLTTFFNSNTYKKIQSFKDFRNEFEIYLKKDEYFLHGIIDKLVFDDKRILIFDYKTDDVEENDVQKRGEFYLMQLKFYLYIASKLFKEFDHFEGNLIFIKHPDISFKIFYDSQNLFKLQSELEFVIKRLRQRKAEKNLKHCDQCVYSNFTNKCIIN